MRVMALGLAAALAAMTITAPGSAKSGNGSGNSHHGGGNHHGGHGQIEGFPTFPNLALPDNLRQTGRRHDHGFVGGGYGYGYGYGYVDDRTFRSDSYNDWWHDRPDRAYPRWVQAQRNAESCEPDRMWWHGDTLGC